MTRHIYAVTAMAALLTALSLGTGHYRSAAPNSSNVTVINTANNPVPTVAQGTTTVSGNVGITGTPSVSISGTPSVSVSNFPSTQTVSVSGTPSVDINSLPAVQVSNFPSTQQVSVTGTPSVSISGTPTVGFADGSSVSVNNNANNPIPVHETGAAGEPVEFAIGGTFNGGVTESGGDTTYQVPAGKRLTIQFVSATAFILAGQKMTTMSVGDDLLPLTDMGHGPMNGSGDWEFFHGAQMEYAVFGPGTSVQAFGRRSDGTATGVFEVVFHGTLQDAP